MDNNFDSKIDSLINSIGSGYEKKFKNIKFKLSNTTLFTLPSNVNIVDNSNSINNLLNNVKNEYKNKGIFFKYYNIFFYIYFYIYKYFFFFFLKLLYLIFN